MTRGEMRSLLREWVTDTQTTEWSDTRADTHLNIAALDVLIQLAQVQHINLARGTEDFTTTAGTLAYTMTATDAAFLKRMYQLGDDRSKDIPATMVSEDSRFIGRTPTMAPITWPYYVTRSHAGNDWIINFLRDPGGGHNFRIEYVVRTATITAGSSGSDSSEYTQIPPEYHTLVPAKAAFYMNGANGSNQRFAAVNYQMLFDQMTMSASMSAPGQKTIDRW